MWITFLSAGRKRGSYFDTSWQCGYVQVKIRLRLCTEENEANSPFTYSCVRIITQHSLVWFNVSQWRAQLVRQSRIKFNFTIIQVTFFYFYTTQLLQTIFKIFCKIQRKFYFEIHTTFHEVTWNDSINTI